MKAVTPTTHRRDTSRRSTPELRLWSSALPPIFRRRSRSCRETWRPVSADSSCPASLKRGLSVWSAWESRDVVSGEVGDGVRLAPGKRANDIVDLLQAPIPDHSERVLQMGNEPVRQTSVLERGPGCLLGHIEECGNHAMRRWPWRRTSEHRLGDPRTTTCNECGVISTRLSRSGSARRNVCRTCRRFVRACSVADSGHNMAANRSREMATRLWTIRSDSECAAVLPRRKGCSGGPAIAGVLSSH